MNKRFLIWLLTILSLATGSSADAQPAKKNYRIGYLSSADPASDGPRYELHWAALRELGYIEGQNLAVERRYAEGKRERQAELAAELVRLNVEVILLAGGDSVVRAAMSATKTIPLVLTQGSDPVKAGFVQSLAHRRQCYRDYGFLKGAGRQAVGAVQRSGSQACPHRLRS